MADGPTDPRILEELARVIRKRRDGCPVLLGVALASAGLALGLSQADIDAAHELAASEGQVQFSGPVSTP